MVQPMIVQQDSLQTFPHFKRTPAMTTSNITDNSQSSIVKNFQASTSGPKIPITSTTKCEFQKTALDYRIHVHNGFVQTANGLLAKVTTFHITTGKLWETFVGKLNDNHSCSILFIICFNNLLSSILME